MLTSGFARTACVLLLATLLAPACQRAPSRPAVSPATAAAEDFHRSDPRTIAATGRPQLLEFFGVT